MGNRFAWSVLLAAVVATSACTRRSYVMSHPGDPKPVEVLAQAEPETGQTGIEMKEEVRDTTAVEGACMEGEPDDFYAFDAEAARLGDEAEGYDPALAINEFSDSELASIRSCDYDIFNGSAVAKISLDEMAQNFVYPFDGIFSSDYGYRKGRMHSGVDISARNGATEVKAAMDGVVRISKYFSGYGNVIVVRHANGLESVYAHNRTNLVQVGEQVRAGQQIAVVGATGRATGPHLHFEIRANGECVDPNLFVDVRNKTLKTGEVYLHPINGKVYASTQSEKSKVVVNKYHTVKKGDTLYAISRKYGLTLSQLCSKNNISQNTVLKIGRTLKVN